MLSLSSYSLFFFFSAVISDRDVGIAPFFLEAAAEVVVAAVHGAGAALTGHEVVAVLGFDFVSADIAADSVANDHSCSSSSCFSLTPTRTPSTKPDRWWSLQRVQTG